jgi:acyl carrier protein
MEEIFYAQLREVLDAENKTVARDDKFRDYDEWNSLANLSLIAMLDDSYGVIIPSEEFKKIQTVGELLDEIVKRKQ